MAYKFNNNTKSRNSKKKCKLSSKYSRKKIYGGTNKFIQDNISKHNIPNLNDWGMNIHIGNNNNE